MENTPKEKISIVVPVYNVEPYIRKCVKSLIHQTYKNLEIILIYDGSPDNCGKICDAFAQEDDRIIVIHQKNGGLSAARNAGLDAASGEYIGFVDSDDWTAPDMFEYLIDNIKKYDADITSCTYYRVESNNSAAVSVDKEIHVYDKVEATERLIKEWALFWNKLFKKTLFDNIKFPKGRNYEGTYLIHTIYGLAEKIVYLPEPKYFYYINKQSILNTKSVKNLSDCVFARIKRYNDLHEMYPNLKHLLMEKVLLKCPDLTVACYGNKKEGEKNGDTLAFIKTFLINNLNDIKKIKTSFIVKRALRYLVSSSNFALFFVRWTWLADKFFKKLLQKSENDNFSQTKSALFKKTLELMLGYKKPARMNHTLSMEDWTLEDKHIFAQLHKKEIEILDEFVRICDKNDLKYYLYGGTLLGAVRHGGFIPWDDDIDIVMLRDDFEKFAVCCETELDTKYFYQTGFTDPAYTPLYAKIRLNNSYVRDEKYEDAKIHKGIYIDILPLDNMPTSKSKCKKLLKRVVFLNKLCSSKQINKSRKTKNFAAFIAGFFSQKDLFQARKKCLEKAHSYKGENVCSFGSHYRPFIKRVLKKEWFSGDEYMIFEGKSYRVPFGWKEYLVHLFGEKYMELPPVEARENHINFYEVKFNMGEEAIKYEKV
jgi:phosphorylcholine metabolism protein LicD/glycosyltransferase involved in cell wall biosynthesis